MEFLVSSFGLTSCRQVRPLKKQPQRSLRQAVLTLLALPLLSQDYSTHIGRFCREVAQTLGRQDC